MASKIATKGKLICVLPASGDVSTSKRVEVLEWDQEGRLLVGQYEYGSGSTRTGGLDRLTIDQDKGQLLKAENLHTEQCNGISSVSVNKCGDLGAVISGSESNDFKIKVYFNITTGESSEVWSPIDRDGRCFIAMFGDKFCISSGSSIFVYSLVDKSQMDQISFSLQDFNARISCMARVDENRLVLIQPPREIRDYERESDGEAHLWLVDINIRRKHSVIPQYPDGSYVLSYPRCVSCDTEGKIYVSDSEKKKVFVFSPQGKYLTTLGGDLEEGLQDPYALAVCSRPGKCPLLSVSEKSEVKIYALKDE